MKTDNDVLILFTMDVELVAVADGKTSGPQSLAEGERNTRDYAGILADYGYSPTLFVHPELGEFQAPMLLDLRSSGAELGLHIHTAKFAERPHDCEMGGLTASEQHDVLSAAIAMFESYFDFRPVIFRPGCFSANDASYGVLHDLGFTGGSISIPGRVWHERFCHWANAEPHPHFAHDAFRQVAGHLPFVDIPLSVDRIGGLQTHPLGFQHYVDLRPGGVYSHDEDTGRDHSILLRNIVQQLLDENPLLKTIVIDVHNDRDFRDPASPSARQLKTILDGLKPELAKHGFLPVSATLSEAISRYRELATSP